MTKSIEVLLNAVNRSASVAGVSDCHQS